MLLEITDRQGTTFILSSHVSYFRQERNELHIQAGTNHLTFVFNSEDEARTVCETLAQKFGWQKQA